MGIKSFVRNYALHTYAFKGCKEDYFVATLIHKYMRGTRVLDLGCGPVVRITSIFYPDAKKVVAVDRLQTNLDFIRRKSSELRDIIQRARFYKRRYLSKTDSNLKIRLVKGDVTKRLCVGTFDSVMNLGCFGALDTAKQFQAAVNHAYHYLKKGGTLLMVNWVGKANRPYHFNGKVHEPDVFAPSLKKAGFKIRELHVTSSVVSAETKKMGYKKIIWAVGEK